MADPDGEHRRTRIMNTLTTSVSQCKDVAACNTKWYLKKVMKCPSIFAASTTRGSILHEVLERYSEADDRGIDPKTQSPIIMYPDNWVTKTDERSGQTKDITYEEQAWIRRIVPLAEEMGILWRPPGRVIEHKFEHMLLPAIPEEDLPEINIVGYIDLAYDFTIIDHKSMKNTRYALNSIRGSERYIGDDVQLLTYCYYWAMHQHSLGHELPKEMDVEHWQYPFEDDNKQQGYGIPQKAHATVTWIKVLENLEALKKVADTSRRLRKLELSEVPKNDNECGSYGGCQFRALCAGQESVTMYCDRTNYAINPEKYLIDKENEHKQLTNTEDEDMSDAFNDLLAGLESGDTANTAPSPVAENQVVETKPETETETNTVIKETPNYKVDFPKEELLAKIAALESCGMSDMAAPLREQLVKVEAQEKAEADAKVEAAKVEAAKVEAQKKALAAAQEKALEQEQEQVEEVETVTNIVAETTNVVNTVNPIVQPINPEAGTIDSPEVLKHSAKRNSGFILLINTSCTGYTKHVTIQAIYASYLKQLGDHREICARAEQIVTAYKGFVVTANFLDEATRELVGYLSAVDGITCFTGIQK